MVHLGSLWLPILLASVLVFFVSFLVHMVLKYHKSDYSQLPNEDAVRAAIRSGNPAPAQYIIPYCSDPKKMREPEMQKKYTEGPIAVLNLLRPGMPVMGKMLGQWFALILVVSLVIAYVASHALPPGARYMDVFRVVGATGFLAYAAGAIIPSIWMGKPWRITWKEVFDGLLYGLVTAGTFGWLWPR